MMEVTVMECKMRYGVLLQHGVGGFQTIFRNAYNNVLKRDDVRGDKTKVTDEMLINAIYDDRSVEVKFKGPNLKFRSGIQIFTREKDALAKYEYNLQHSYNICRWSKSSGINNINLGVYKIESMMHSRRISLENTTIYRPRFIFRKRVRIVIFKR